MKMRDIDTRLQILERSYREVQKLRIAASNRIDAYVRDGRMDEEQAKILHRHIDDIIAESEDNVAQLMTQEVKKHPLWEWAEGCKGLGPRLTSQFIGEGAPVEKAPHASSMCKYAGFHVICNQCGADWQLAKSRGTCPACGREAKSTAPDRQSGHKVDYNTALKTVCWKIGNQFVKTKGSYYRKVYLRYKEYEQEHNTTQMRGVEDMPGYLLAQDVGTFEEGDRIKSRGEDSNFQELKEQADRAGLTAVAALRTPQHVHNRALRKMIHQFICDIWAAWRRCYGLPVSEPYPIAILGHDKDSGKRQPPSQPGG